MKDYAKGRVPDVFYRDRETVECLIREACAEAIEDTKLRERRRCVRIIERHQNDPIGFSLFHAKDEILGTYKTGGRKR